MALEQWALPRLSKILPLDEAELRDVLSYTKSLPESEGAEHLRGMLGDSPETNQFIISFYERRSETESATTKDAVRYQDKEFAPPAYPPPSASKATGGSNASMPNSTSKLRPTNRPSENRASRARGIVHTNAVIEAAQVRARDEVRSMSWCLYKDFC